MATLAFDVGIVNMALSVGEAGYVRYCDVFRIGGSADGMDALVRDLLRCLDERRERIGQVARVLIEQQLGRAASKNFALSAVLFAHACQRYPEASVKFINPRQKFKALANLKNVPGISERSEEFRTTRGTRLKKLAVEAAQALATYREDDLLLERLRSCSKKDDIADAALYSLLC